MLRVILRRWNPAASLTLSDSDSLSLSDSLCVYRPQEYVVDGGVTEDRSIAWDLAPSLPQMPSIESVEFEFGKPPAAAPARPPASPFAACLMMLMSFAAEDSDEDTGGGMMMDGSIAEDLNDGSMDGGDDGMEAPPPFG